MHFMKVCDEDETPPCKPPEEEPRDVPRKEVPYCLTILWPRGR